MPNWLRTNVMATMTENTLNGNTVAQSLSQEQFLKVASAVRLVNHGRNWQVSLGAQNLGFADGDCPEKALIEAHKREVNNALWVLEEETSGIEKTIPSIEAASSYPELQSIFPKAWERMISGESISKATEASNGQLALAL